MVSKEPDHLLTGQNNGKSTLADKLPGTMTVRSVLLNRDSPDIESRLKRRRNRTHQVRFKDLEDGSSSSGNSGTGENNSHPRPAKDCDSPHPFRKHNSRSVQPWTDRDRPLSAGLPGQTSVVGAVRGDMASTIEVVAAFLARAPPHPLTPGPTRRCWAPPQTNSLTLPMTRKPSTSTSTAIQTSPCLKKPQSLSSTHTRSHSLGDSFGVDGDDEQDSQDEYITHNNVLFSGSKDQNGASEAREQPAVERRSKSSRTELKSAVTVLKTSKHSFSSSALHNSEPYQCSSVPSRDGSKRQGCSTPSVARRRKRLSRTTSDPGKEVHYCTTPTQTEIPGPTLLSPNTKLCTTQVQTESPSPPPISQYCTTQCQTEIPPQSSTLIDEHCTSQSQTMDSSVLPPNSEQCSMEDHLDSPTFLSPNHNSCTTHTQTSSPDASPTVTASPSSDQPHSETPAPLPKNENPPNIQIATVPYCPSPPPQASLVLTPEHCANPPCSYQSMPAHTSRPPSPPPPMSYTTSAPIVTQFPIPYYTVVSPPTTTSPLLVCSTPSSVVAPCPTSNCNSPISKLASVPSVTCSMLPTVTTPAATSSEPNTHATRTPNISHSPDEIVSSSTSIMNSVPCTFVTQTAMSCTSISYYTTTHPVVPHVPHINPTAPTYATVIQTVSQCNIPCQAQQIASSAMTGITPYSSPVPKIKSCTSPIPFVKAFVSNLPNALSSATPTKVVPLYSSTFRPAPPYTPPSQAPHSAQDKRGIRLPPPPPPPPPYTPRKQGTDTPGPTFRTPILRSETKTSENSKEKEKREDNKCTESPQRCERASSLKHRTQTPSVAVMKGDRPSSTSSPAKACFKPSCLSSAQAHLGVLHKMLCSGANARPHTPSNQHMLPQNLQGCPTARRCSAPGEQPTAAPLTATQADTLRQVQEILGGLVSGARCKLDPARVTEKLLGPNGPLHDIKSLQSHLHSLEGVLETSQNTIKVLLDVIQDLEKKEAEKDGRHLYRTGQDTDNCGTCRDCACIIYRSQQPLIHQSFPLHQLSVNTSVMLRTNSVEHDFRLQEGQVVRTWKVGDPPEEMPPAPTPTPTPSTPSQQDSPQPVRPPATNKKNRKKCFWFL